MPSAPAAIFSPAGNSPAQPVAPPSAATTPAPANVGTVQAVRGNPAAPIAPAALVASPITPVSPPTAAPTATPQNVGTVMAAVLNAPDDPAAITFVVPPEKYLIGCLTELYATAGVLEPLPHLPLRAVGGPYAHWTSTGLSGLQGIPQSGWWIALTSMAGYGEPGYFSLTYYLNGVLKAQWEDNSMPLWPDLGTGFVATWPASAHGTPWLVVSKDQSPWVSFMAPPLIPPSTPANIGTVQATPGAPASPVSPPSAATTPTPANTGTVQTTLGAPADPVAPPSARLTPTPANTGAVLPTLGAPAAPVAVPTSPATPITPAAIT